MDLPKEFGESLMWIKSFLLKRVFSSYETLNKQTKERALNMMNLIMDNKPIVLKEWEDDSDLLELKIKKIHLWIQLPNLPVRYWG